MFLPSCLTFKFLPDLKVAVSPALTKLLAAPALSSNSLSSWSTVTFQPLSLIAFATVVALTSLSPFTTGVATAPCFAESVFNTVVSALKVIVGAFGLLTSITALVLLPSTKDTLSPGFTIVLSIGLPSALLPLSFQPDAAIVSATSFVDATLSALTSVEVTSPVAPSAEISPKSTLILTVDFLPPCVVLTSATVPVPLAKSTVS